MDLYFEIAGNQIEGARDYQEDAFMVTHMGDGEDSSSAALVIMADGMGGHAAGNVASNMATSTFNKTFSGQYPTEKVADALKAGLLASNETIRAAIAETPGLQGMGCTMVTAFVAKSKLYWVSVGDSHLYTIRDRNITKVNADHSYGGYLKRMEQKGIPVEPDPKLSPNMLMSAMIGDEIAEIDLSEEAVQLLPGDRVIVASDGLDTLGQGALIQYSAWSSTARECVNALLKAVEDAAQPRQDNTTVIVIDIKERIKEEAAPAEELVLEGGAEKPEPRSPSAPVTVREAVGEQLGAEEPPRGKLGLMLGLLAVVLLVLGGAAYYLFMGDKPAPVVAERPPAPAPQPAPVAPAPVAPAPTPPKPKPVAPPAPQPVAPAPAPPSPRPAAPESAPAQAAQPSFTPRATLRDTLRDGGRGPQMVKIPGGSFRMGGAASALSPDERPRRVVTVEPFAMSAYEVTFAEYDRFAKATRRKRPDSEDWDRATHPAVNVSWDDAYQYARWLSKQTGHKYRLPSEAEWEYAARAGSKTNYWWGYRIGKENAHCFDCKSGLHPRKPAKVGLFKPNPVGIYDTAGNVWEWVHDCYHPNYRGAPEDGSVWEGGDCTRRVARGGSYSSASTSLRSAKREKFVSDKGYDDVGIRLVRELP